jgi:hypothetical protein
LGLIFIIFIFNFIDVLYKQLKTDKLNEMMFGILTPFH